jgi:hypothetical protein
VKTTYWQCNLLTLDVSPIEEIKSAFFFISTHTHTAAELNRGNVSTNFLYWTPHGLLQGGTLQLHQVRSRQPVQCTDVIPSTIVSHIMNLQMRS